MSSIGNLKSGITRVVLFSHKEHKGRKKKRRNENETTDFDDDWSDDALPDGVF